MKYEVRIESTIKGHRNVFLTLVETNSDNVNIQDIFQVAWDRVPERQKVASCVTKLDIEREDHYPYGKTNGPTKSW